MGDTEDIGYIKLISPVQPTAEERNDANYIPKLQIHPEAMTIISDQFESPISILVYVGREGVGKSKLASLTVASLQKKKCVKPLSPFRSGDNVKNVTDGIWMWRSPLKDPSNNKGSILLLDCEGISHFDENRSGNLYLFCMIISTAFAVILRPPRADHGQCNRIYDTLRCFEQMKAPSVLPNVWLVPLGLAELKNDDRIISPDEWIEKVFSLDEFNNTLTTTQNEQLKLQYNYIRTKLPRIGAMNISRLPAVLEDDNQKLDDLFTSLREQSSENYHKSLCNTINQFLRTGGKRIPGSSSNSIFIRPAELAQFMSDLIGVINTTSTPNSDELIGQYLLTRFNDGIVKKNKDEFQQKLLFYADQYAKENLQEIETEIEKKKTNTILHEERNRLTEAYITKMKQLAEERIYGRNSILLSLNLFQNRLNEVREEMNKYRDSELLIEGIRKINESNDQNAEEIKHSMLEETKKKLDRLADWIWRERRINKSLDVLSGMKELQVELEECSKCYRAAGPTNVIHAKEDCNNSSGRHGNYYRYNNEQEQMVCDACRKLTRIPSTRVKCTICGTVRRITRI